MGAGDVEPNSAALVRFRHGSRSPGRPLQVMWERASPARIAHPYSDGRATGLSGGCVRFSVLGGQVSRGWARCGLWAARIPRRHRDVDSVSSAGQGSLGIAGTGHGCIC